MRKWSLITAVSAGIAVLFISVGIYAGTSMPDVIKMDNKAYEKHKKSIVTFTHKLHVEEYAKANPDFFKAGCGECHHDANGKPLELKIGDPVQGCIECHKIPGERPKGKDAPKLKKKERLQYHAEALHYNCKDCHKKFNRKNKTKKAPTTCSKCHPKKK
ncbi:MAG: cytochrome C [Deltaproteobacteria bacterium]|nr:MAG: cytochrome C [Deltaproteobacteria bacterium]